ncbi:threonine synthase [Balneolaceae bacterium YR4-1]|uniref:Threonine synthase n=1 Tax=Halalkalibaculum roseum TaxID=2709311 RepID=A0A6M1SZH0_9BACT|nr:threonine synthase [Halalkalibaculum roseum]NGP75265.1 threonine synthase [Halalkalibaculum roseum]
MSRFLTHLECSKTGETYDAGTLHNVSEAGYPLFARYDLESIKNSVDKSVFKERNPIMWRYRELLPVNDMKYCISLGEGFTPLRKVDTLGGKLGISNLFIKDESLNPTGSFKARGISAAISAALERGAREFAMPSAGNAAGALAAYAADAGVSAHVFMPKDTPLAFKLECEYYGAEMELIDGLITDCGQIIQKRKEKEGWYEISTLKEPYRLEGKKTMGFELAEQFEWELPDVVIYPTGGGTGLIGMWKAFDEMEKLGWIGSKRPRMVSVQTEGCAPIVKAFNNNMKTAEPWQNASTVVSGLRVPSAIGDFLILEALYESEGTAVAVSDEELIDYSKVMAAHTGIFPAPEGGATLAALMKLKEKQWIKDDEKIVLFNTGSGFKYMEALNRNTKTVNAAKA